MALITGQFNDSYKPVMDGVVNVVRNYAYWLNRKYGKSFVITPAFPQYIDDEEFEVIRYFSTVLPRRSPYRLGIPQLDFYIRKKISRIPFDIVHAHCPFSSGQIALQLARRKGIPIVATFHSKYYEDFKEALRLENLARFFVKKVIGFYNSVDTVWTVNKATINTLREYGFRGNVDVMPNGTDFEPVYDRDKEGAEIRKALRLEEDEPLLLFVGQHIWQKNLEMLVKSLCILKNLGVRYHMVFAGRGCAEKELKRMCSEMGLKTEVTFMGQIMDREFLKKLYAGATVFLFPSMYDNSPLVVREAAAAGCPSLLIKGSNSAEDVKDGFNGFLTENDPVAYAHSIKETLASMERCKSAGDNARRTLYRSWKQIADKVAERYIELIKDHRNTKLTVKGIS
jgi:1,2-diacylglycerol 3-alpha-glucosyltransferase